MVLTLMCVLAGSQTNVAPSQGALKKFSVASYLGKQLSKMIADHGTPPLEPKDLGDGNKLWMRGNDYGVWFGDGFKVNITFEPFVKKNEWNKEALTKKAKIKVINIQLEKEETDWKPFLAAAGLSSTGVKANTIKSTTGLTGVKGIPKGTVVKFANLYQSSRFYLEFTLAKS